MSPRKKEHRSMLDLKTFTQKTTDFLIFLEIEKNLSSHTQRAYRSDLRQFIEFWERIGVKEAADMPINRVMERFLVFMYNQKINKSSIARKISCLKSLQRFLKNQGVDLNLHLTRPKTAKKLPIYLSVDEISLLLDQIKPEQLPSKKPLRDMAIMELLYATGVRCSELVNICFSDLDFENKTIRILGKGNKERLVLFGEKAKNKLVNYIENERAVVHNLNEKLFLNGSRQAITVRTVQRIVEMFRQFLKINRPITPHKIRHSFATHMLNQGVPLRVVQELLGHKSLSSTEIYTHVTTTELRELCNTIHPIKDMLKKKESPS